MMFSVNSSPFVGKDGKYVTSRNLREAPLQGARVQRGAEGRGSEEKARSRSAAAACFTWAS